MTRARAGLLVLAALCLAPPGCALVSQGRLDESQKLSQTLRSENTRLRDQILALEGQNRDLSERAVDDARRIAAQDDAVEHLEKSVMAYQDDRRKLESAYRRLVASLGLDDKTGGSVIDRDNSDSGSDSRQTRSPRASALQ